MRRILIQLAVLLQFACQSDRSAHDEQHADQNGVVREIEPDTISPSGEVKVKLHVNLDSGQTYYLLDEIPAEGFTVIDAETDSEGHIKSIDIQDAKSTVLEYTLRSPDISGGYSFGGEYAIEGMRKSSPIKGETIIVVQ